jgi:hypothetical protein
VGRCPAQLHNPVAAVAACHVRALPLKVLGNPEDFFVDVMVALSAAAMDSEVKVRACRRRDDRAMLWDDFMGSRGIAHDFDLVGRGVGPVIVQTRS